MHLTELFGGSTLSLSDRLRQAALDIITPLVAHKVPFITVQQILADLQDTRPGIMVDRALIMDLLEPSEVKAINRIEGDRIYLQPPEQAERKLDPSDAQAELDAVKDKAKAQAQRDVKSGS